MPNQKPSRPVVPPVPVANPQPQPLPAATGLTAAARAARRPVVPTHAAGTTQHSQHHLPRSAQS